jgi:predicted transposase YdaD
MFQDILRESWVYQEIGQHFLEEGRKEGREEGREEERRRRAEGQRELLMSFVQARFPEIAVLAKQQAERITDPEVLQHVIIKLLAAQGLDEAKRVLLDVNKGENRH